MRMWMVDPSKMCRKHLLGEHVELHMLVGSINRGKSIQGFLDKNLLEPQHIKERHAQLVTEMARRGFKHNSPLPKYETSIQGYVDPQESLRELSRRCQKCQELQCENEELAKRDT